ncbi:spore germination protein [Ureibacillus sp. Re31]|uniref:Spore germination protein n=2 Tax=Bacillales TaxID=1385 RepID=A0ABR8XEH4_9BACL|nr:spore germination protein [Ureibacillus galli]MBD8027606.1 spore germination protein [Ureibacillus galli]
MNFFKKQAKQIDVESIKKQLSNSPDLVNRTVTVGNKTIELYFLKILVNRISIEKNIISFLNNSTSEEINLNYLFEHLPITEVKELVETNDISKYILDGFTFIYFPFEKKGLFAGVGDSVERSLGKAETESLVYGPKISFTESLSTNIKVLSIIFLILI